MKLSYLLSAAALAFTLVSCSNEVESAETMENEAQVEKVAVVSNDAVDLKIEGMVCVNGCKGAIEKSLNNTAGIGACNIDFEKGTAHVTFDNKLISNDEIKTAIENVNEGAYTAEFITAEETVTESEEEVVSES